MLALSHNSRGHCLRNVLSGVLRIQNAPHGHVVCRLPVHGMKVCVAYLVFASSTHRSVAYSTYYRSEIVRHRGSLRQYRETNVKLRECGVFGVIRAMNI
jgi:hypothetical protein